MKQFDFGQNWIDFSAHAATEQRVSQARAHFNQLIEGISLDRSTFLDIGFGQGFSLLAASAMGARVVGCDINPKCNEAISRNRALFRDLGEEEIPLHVGSILDDRIVEALRRCDLAQPRGYDVVHSWGVLHHTGDLHRAIVNAGSLVCEGGYFIIAIYNRHWSSASWLWIKRLYARSPNWLRRLLVAMFYPVIWTAKWIVTRKPPGNKERGMDFYYDVVDWVGGYPYEYASVLEIETFCQKLGFSLVRAIPAKVPTGCNEFIFRKHRGPD